MVVIVEYTSAVTAPAPAVRKMTIGYKGVVAFGGWVALTLAYFVFRIPLWNPEHPILSGMLLFAELFGVVNLCLHVFMTWTLVERPVAPPEPGATADIFVTTWNEPVDLLRRTLLAARQVRHAEAVWLLDDGCRPAMRELAEELGVRYLARAERDHAKAGNLNNALKYSTAPYCAIFDADHAPAPDFLEKTLGYFRDEKMAFVQTPQDFYNLDSFQHRPDAKATGAWHEQMLFYRVIQPGKDRWNAAFFCGSCAVARKAALEDIGGIATGTITEDIHTSLRLQKRGWNSGFQSEVLAFGLSPFNWEQYETQRLRWGRGAMQVWRTEGVLFRGGAMNLGQRLCYLASIITYFEGWQRGLLYFLPAFVLLTGAMPLTTMPLTFVGLFICWMMSSLLVCEVFGRGYAKSLWMEEYNFFRYFTFMKATLALLTNFKFKFRVTPKTGDKEANLVAALLPQGIVVLAGFAGMIGGTILFLRSGHLPPVAFAANLIWVAVVLGVAFRGLNFAVKNWGQMRNSYRFRLPVPTTVAGRSSGELYLGLDISPQGMSLVVPAGVAGQDYLHVSIWLPDGALNVPAHVRRRTPTADGGEELGLSFAWRNPGDIGRLEAFLYGNSLQWSVNNWVIDAPNLARSKRRRAADRQAPGDWAVGTVRFGAKALVCTARGQGTNWRAVVYEHPDTDRADDLTLGGVSMGGAKVERVRKVETPSGPIFILNLNCVPAPLAAPKPALPIGAPAPTNTAALEGAWS